MAETKLLLTGATGYIGGSVLARLQASSNPVLKGLAISALVRRQTQADALRSMGITPILFEGLEDVHTLKKAAREHDIIVNTACSTHTEYAKALISGLAERKEQTGKVVHYVHTSGTSNLGDYPVTKKYVHPEGRVFSDKEDVLSYLKEREAFDPYPQRGTDITVIETSKEMGVRTYILMCPTVYGVGSGAFNKLSVQVPLMIRSAIEGRVAQYAGDGRGVCDHVHIDDLVDLYEIMLGKILAGETIDSGYYFSDAGRHRWLEVAQAIGKAGYELGALDTPTPVSVSLQDTESAPLREAVDKWHGGNVQLAELSFAPGAMTTGEKSRELGWKPKKTDEDWANSIKEEFQIIFEETKRSKDQ